LEEDVLIQGCTFTDQYYTPYISYYQSRLHFWENYCDQTRTTAYFYKYASFFYYGYDLSIERNTFIAEGGTYAYGVYLYYSNYYHAGSTRFVNNMVSMLGQTYGYYSVYNYNNANLLFAHNTIHMNSTYASGYNIYQSSGSNQQYLNNIFYHSGAGYSFYAGTPSAITESDYNVYYSNGSYLAY
jgi:hypothetical protein